MMSDNPVKDVSDTGGAPSHARRKVNGRKSVQDSSEVAATCDAASNEEIGNGDADDAINHKDLSKNVSGAGAAYASAKLYIDKNPFEAVSSDSADNEGFSSDLTGVVTNADGFSSVKIWTRRLRTRPSLRVGVVLDGMES